MKKITLLTLFLLGLLQSSVAQVGVSVNFNASTILPAGWTVPTGTFTVLNTVACDGNSVRSNLFGFVPTSNLVTPNFVAGSNGTDVAFSFDYKIIDYFPTSNPTPAGWGSLFVESSADNGVTWTVKKTINDLNHIVSTTCANVAFTIPAAEVPAGTDLKFRFRGVRTAGDFFIYLDNILITQTTSLPPNCNAQLVQPAVNATNANITGNLSWLPATGVATGYNLSVGTTPGGSNIFPVTNVGNVTNYNVGALVPATTYYVSIVPFNSNGNATNCTNYSFATYSPITNDDCSGATVLTVNPTLTCTAVAQGTVQGATASTTNATSCFGTEDDDVWYSFVATNARHRISLLNIVGSVTDMFHSLWTGADCNALTLVPNSCSDNDVSTLINLTVGTTYYIRVYTYTNLINQNTSFDICVSTLPPANVGSLCTNPLIVSSLPFTATDNTINYEDVNYEGSPGATGCGTTAPYLNGNDVIYSYTAATSGSVKIDLDTTGTWSGLFVYTSCASIGTACVAGGVNPVTSGVTIPDFAVEAGQTYYIVISTYPTPQTIPYTLTILENTCTNPTATYLVVNDCANGAQFLIDVNITSLGSATSLTLSDGVTPQVISVTGPVTLGPFPNGTPVTITLTNDQDATCTISSLPLNQAVCPPVNDLCSGAIDLGTLSSPYSSTTVGATNDNFPSCNTTGTQPDIYYSILVPNNSTLRIGQTVNSYDSVHNLFYGDCTNKTALTCVDEPEFGTYVWANTTGSDKTVYWVQDGYGTFANAGTFTLQWSVVACANATATYTVVSDCANGAQFLIDVNITGLGTATSLTLSDGVTPQVISVTGPVTLGPYPNATPVTITIVNNQDSSCSITSGVLNQLVCPPVNDSCAAAISLTLGTDFASGKITTSSLGATLSPELPFPLADFVEPNNCGGLNFAINGKDIWYKVTVPASGNFKVETKNGVLPLTDTAIQVYSGTCAAFVPVTCDDDSGDANFSLATVTGQTPGAVLYLRVHGYGGQSGVFDISAYSTSLASNSFDNAAFMAYPNPVKDILNLSYSQNIDKVQVTNMLGQEVFAKSVNATNASVDISNLANGTYLVRITADNQQKTIKIVKQ